jgi:hypothetical protein
MSYTDEQKEKIRQLCFKQRVHDMMKFSAGDALIAVGTANTHFQPYELVTAVTDAIEGIFETRPYITVLSNDGRRSFVHASRFVPASAIDEVPI